MQRTKVKGDSTVHLELRISTRVILPPRGHLATSGDIFGRHSCRDVIGLLRVEAKDAVEYPLMHCKALYNRIFWPKMSTVLS